METLASKQFIWWGNYLEKSYFFFKKKRNKEKLMKGFEVIMTRVSTASLPSPSLPPKMETRNKDRAKP